MFYDFRFISYNNSFKKGINWHHLTFKDKEKNKTVAILNGCEKNIKGKKVYISCDGVSFGGFLWREKLNVVDYITTVSAFKEYLKRNDFSSCIIRNQPFLYQKHLNEEYEYSLINQGFIISNHSITNIINLNEFEFEKLTNPKKRAIQKSEKNIVITLRYLRHCVFFRSLSLLIRLSSSIFVRRYCSSFENLSFLHTFFAD